MMLEATAGRSSPQGAAVVDGGVNFRLFSHLATGIKLLLFDREDAPAEWALPAGSE
jgi:hypothetical protein